MQAAWKPQSLRENQRDVLQVALAPSPVAFEKFDQGRRRGLVTAADVGRQPEVPAGASQQRRFDKIVAHDFAAKRRRARQDWKATMVHERPEADNGIVAPVIPVWSLQPGEPGRID